MARCVGHLLLEQEHPGEHHHRQPVDMAPSCAPHVTRKMVREVLDPAVEDRSKPPFAYVLNHVPPAFTDPSKPLYETEEEALAQKTLRESLALQAQTRYEQWLEENPAPKIVGEPSRSTHPTHHMFRVRTREKELAPKHWQNPNRVLHERERIEAVLDSALYMRHPPYPKQGGGIKNLGFSYMSAAYDYRQRQPSKEVSGTVSMLRTRPRTESERINKSLQAQPPVEESEEVCSLRPRTAPPLPSWTIRGLGARANTRWSAASVAWRLVVASAARLRPPRS